MPYTTLLLACGTRPTTAVRGALTFRGPADTSTIDALLAELEAGIARRVAFVVPTSAVWSLPAYELALMTAAWLDRHAIDAEVTVVTPETAPLQLFGGEASEAVSAVLEQKGVTFHGGADATEARPGELLLVGDGIVVADRVVALPRLEGRRIGGISQTLEGFIPVDQHGRVAGVEDVYAAGDITAFYIKQGGIAAQQAEAAAESIAADAGAEVVPRPFRPVLRGLLLTGSEPRYLHTELGGGGTSWASPEPLWWPPSKIVGRYLSPFLAAITQTPVPTELSSSPTGIAVEAALEASTASRRDRLAALAVPDRTQRFADNPRRRRDVHRTADRRTRRHIGRNRRAHARDRQTIGVGYRVRKADRDPDVSRHASCGGRASPSQRGTRAPVDDGGADHGDRLHATRHRRHLDGRASHRSTPRRGRRTAGRNPSGARSGPHRHLVR